MRIVDFAVRDDGTIWVFSPLTERAHEHAESAFANAMTFGTSYVVEHRYAPPIIDDLLAEGFEVNLEGIALKPGLSNFILDADDRF